MGAAATVLIARVEAVWPPKLAATCHRPCRLGPAWQPKPNLRDLG